MMTEDRFLQILAAYGSNPARWPDGERAAAQAFLAGHVELTSEAIAAEAALDAVLGSAARPPSDLLERRVLRSLNAMPARGWRAPAAAAAAALLLGVFLGFSSGALLSPEESAVETYYADAFTGLDEDWVDWLEIDA
tara:strand:+ start:16361 stop:16771 length:411 start_codon:yes stop_codon:yes gene_type:complete